MSETNTNPEARDVIAQWLTDEYGGSNWMAADAIIAALSAAGMVVVPRGIIAEAFEDGCDQFWDHSTGMKKGPPQSGEDYAVAILASLPTPTLPPAGDDT